MQKKLVQIIEVFAAGDSGFVPFPSTNTTNRAGGTGIASRAGRVGSLSCFSSSLLNMSYKLLLLVRMPCL